MRVVKRLGWDWTIFYRWDNEPGIHEMSVFGAMSPEQALEDAHSSLGEDYDIIGIVRQDLSISAPGPSGYPAEGSE